jgi:hypothetical protein
MHQGVHDIIFIASYVVVAPVWLLLMVAPRHRVTDILNRSALASLVVAILYLVLTLAHIGDAEGSFWTLDGVAQLFAHRHVVLIGWLHYLCFDLFVGSWIARDARRNRLPHWLVVPCLFFTLMLGPIGLLMYFAIRLGRTGRWVIAPEEDNS